MPVISIDSPTVRIENTVTRYISNSFASFWTSSMNFYTGLSNDDKVAPAIIVCCHNAQETYFQTRVYSFDVEIAAKDIAADTTTASFNSMAGNIFSLFGDSKTSSLSMNVSNSNLCVFQTQVIDYANTHQEDSWGVSMNLKIVGALI